MDFRTRIYRHQLKWLTEGHLGVKSIRTTTYKTNEMLDTLSLNPLPTKISGAQMIAKDMSRNVSILNYTFQPDILDRVVAQAIRDVPESTQVPPVPNK